MIISKKRKSIILMVLALMASLSLMFCFMQTNTVKAAVSTSDALKIRGASVRTIEPYGLRFHTTMDEDTYNTYSTKANVIFGLLLIPEDLYDGELTLGTSNVQNCITYQTDAEAEISINYWKEIDDPQEGEDETDKEAKVYLYNIPRSSFNSNVVARSYIKDGEDIIYSSGTLTRSVAMVAKGLLDKEYADPNGILDGFLINYGISFFDSDGTTIIDAQQVKYGDDFTSPVAPEKEGFNFLGWKKRIGTVSGAAVWSDEYYDFTADNACVVTKNMQFKADFEFIGLNVDLSNPLYVQKGIVANRDRTEGDTFGQPVSKFGFDDVYCFGDTSYYTIMNPIVNNVTNSNYLIFDMYFDVDTMPTYGITLETFRVSNTTNTGLAWHYDNNTSLDSDMTAGILDTEWGKMQFFKPDGSAWGAGCRTALKTWVTVQVKATYDYSSKVYPAARILLTSISDPSNSYIRNLRLSNTPFGSVSASELQVTGFDSSKVYAENETIELSATAIVNGERIKVFPSYTVSSGSATVYNNGNYNAYIVAGAGDSVVTATYGGATFDINIKGKFNIFTKEADLSANMQIGAHCDFIYQASAGPDDSHKVANVAKYTIKGTNSSQWQNYFMPKAALSLPSTGYYLYMSVYIPETQPTYTAGLWQLRGTFSDLWNGINDTANTSGRANIAYQYYDDQGNALTSGKMGNHYGKWVTLEMYIDSSILGEPPAFVNYNLSTDTEWYFANIYATATKLDSIPAIIYEPVI